LKHTLKLQQSATFRVQNLAGKTARDDAYAIGTAKVSRRRKDFQEGTFVPYGRPPKGPAASRKNRQD
jgi:hypothetical protein